jgi:hypothetical protein
MLINFFKFNKYEINGKESGALRNTTERIHPFRQLSGCSAELGLAVE